jgi:hypothetical protein
MRKPYVAAKACVRKALIDDSGVARPMRKRNDTLAPGKTGGKCCRKEPQEIPPKKY